MFLYPILVLTPKPGGDGTRQSALDFGSCRCGKASRPPASYVTFEMKNRHSASFVKKNEQ